MSNAGGVGKNRDSKPIIWFHCLLLTLQQARCCQRGRLWTTATVPQVVIVSLVVSGGVDCGRRRRNVYDKKPQHYAKDNRTAHLTARSDKSVATLLTIKESARRFVLLKLTTDSVEASRGLFATAELFFIFVIACQLSCVIVVYHFWLLNADGCISISYRNIVMLCTEKGRHCGWW